MFDTDLTELGAAATVDHVVDCRAMAERLEVQILRGAAHFADLHALVGPTASRTLPGAERLVLLGGAGTPEVAEFAPAELGAALGISDTSAAMLIGDALDLRHRLPHLWARIRSGEVKSWLGRKIAQATRRCPAEVAAVVDRRVAPFADRLSWGRLEPIVAAAVAEADPDQAEKDAESAAMSVGVFRTPSADHGIVTTVLRTQAPDAIRFDAAIGRVATGLALLGDGRDQNTRRASAVGILADPAQTLDLFGHAAAAAIQDPARADAIGAADGCPAAPAGSTGPASYGGDATPAALTEQAPGATPSIRPRDGRRLPVTESRPDVTLYVHLSDETLRCGRGVTRVEDVGPVIAEQVRAWLTGARVTVRLVLDVAGMAPADSYEIPPRLREATHLLNPGDVFPYATSTHRGQDIDHTESWVPPDHGGPPGQTAIGNLGKLTRRHHRLKTHGRWQLRQPFPGVWIWRSPHGRHYVVDHTGTRPLSSGRTDSAAA